MDEGYTSVFTEEERMARRAQRAAARKKKLRQRRRRQLMSLLPVLLLLVGILAAWSASHPRAEPTEKRLTKAVPVFQPIRPLPVRTAPSFSSMLTEDTVHLGAELPSEFAVLIDCQTGEVLAEKNAQARISPASMTKILTLLVAVEHCEDLDASFPIDLAITDYSYSNDCSVAGFTVGEQVPVQDLLYGTILPSGADAALGLAQAVAGSHEAFVDLMNERAAELGLSDTSHFTNCVGLYDPEHYCTMYDMAMILKEAMSNDLCREVLSARTHQTAPTPEHPEGLLLSNWFLRKSEDHVPEGFTMVGAKTGFVVQSGNCAASLGRNAQGEEFLCVTGHAYSSWRTIYDHVELYKTYCA